MITWFKKNFIPHSINDHRPHVLRRSNVRNIIILIIIVEFFVFLLPVVSKVNKTGGMAAVLPAILASLTNEERQAQNLNTLTVNPALNRAAQMKAEDMANKGYFAHTSPEGKTPWYWLAQAGYSYQYAGENLAIDFTDSADVTRAWMASPTHRANIVKGNYTEMGTGIAVGNYEGHEAIFVAQVYANPIPKAPSEEIVSLAKSAVKPITVKKAVVKNTTTEKPKTIAKAVPTPVLGEQVEKQLEETGTLKISEIAEVESVNKIIPVNQLQENKNLSKPALWQELFASPRTTTNKILFIVFGIMILALALNVFIKFEHHHPDLITNGLAVIAVAGFFFVTNTYLTNKDMIIAESMDYSIEQAL